MALEKDGYCFAGGGRSDDKAQAAVWVANLIRYKREGYKSDSDPILALTADEGEDQCWGQSISECCESCSFFRISVEGLDGEMLLN